MIALEIGKIRLILANQGARELRLLTGNFVHVDFEPHVAEQV